MGKKNILYLGTWKGGNGKVVYLLNSWTDTTVRDSAVVENEKFHMEKPIDRVERCVLIVGDGKREIMLDEVPVEITIEGFLGGILEELITRKLVVIGSPEQDLLEKYLNICLLRACHGISFTGCCQYYLRKNPIPCICDFTSVKKNCETRFR